MTRAAEKLLTQALTLPEDERIDLATEIIASVDGPADTGWQEAWLAEIDRRVQAARQRGEFGAEWPDVRARILARLAGS